MKNSAKIRDQIEEILQGLAPLKNQRPSKGWIRCIREALGMSGRQLAERVGVNVARIAEMEKAEAHGNITLRSIRRAAEAMDCELVYALVPRTTLKAALRSQAEKAARRKLRPVAHTMRLEEQGLPPQEEAKQLAEMAEELSRNPPRWLWDAE